MSKETKIDLSDERRDEELHRILAELMNSMQVRAREIAIAHGVSTARLSTKEKAVIEDVFEQLCTRLVFRLMRCDELQAALDFYRMKEEGSI